MSRYLLLLWLCFVSAAASEIAEIVWAVQTTTKLICLRWQTQAFSIRANESLNDELEADQEVKNCCVCNLD